MGCSEIEISHIYILHEWEGWDGSAARNGVLLSRSRSASRDLSLISRERNTSRAFHSFIRRVARAKMWVHARGRRCRAKRRKDTPCCGELNGRGIVCRPRECGLGSNYSERLSHRYLRRFHARSRVGVAGRKLNERVRALARPIGRRLLADPLFSDRRDFRVPAM